MNVSLNTNPEHGIIEMTAPCRIDMGGTLDMAAFYYSLGRLQPVTFNIALALRTRVRLYPYKKGYVKVSSKGFDTAEFVLEDAPFDHPLGLMFAVAAYFDADGILIDIESASPPRSALGGSSVAAVALCGAFLKLTDPGISDDALRKQAAMTAFYIESSIASGPCGIQDHLAAAYGGVNAWYWKKHHTGPLYNKAEIIGAQGYKHIEDRLLIAYCGEPHESMNVNSTWVRQFLNGVNRKDWIEIVSCTHAFIKALSDEDYQKLYPLMNRETEIRRQMTPHVLDDIGVKLVDMANEINCGVRFTGAGGGGCVWALCEKENRPQLTSGWQQILKSRNSAFLLDTKIDPEGLIGKKDFQTG
ncbi:MAG: galactokinase [Proteobacteria bacterium]|nr:galactokinase [Pseudomonadota bacterium]